MQNNVAQIEIPNAPNDTVSCLRFSSSSVPQTYLMAGSWDKSVRIWEISSQDGVMFRKEKSFQSPVLDCCWSQDCTKAFIACANKVGYMWDLVSDEIIQISSHDSPIKTINFIQTPTYSCLMTGSWDKKLKFWDINTRNLILAFDLSDKVYCADVHYPFAVVGTADRTLSIFDLRGQPKPYKRLNSKLTSQIRCIKILLNNNNGEPFGLFLAGIEGYGAIQFIEDDNCSQAYRFKCHRIINNTGLHEIFVVNDIVRHPIHHTIATMGGDGFVNFWDPFARKRVQRQDHPTEKQSISAGAIDCKGDILACAFGYDWSKGHEYHHTSNKPKIFLRQCFSEFNRAT